MVAELGGIITLNVLGQVIRSDFLCCGSWIVFHAINERILLTALDCICQKRWTVFVDSSRLYLLQGVYHNCWQGLAEVLEQAWGEVIKLWFLIKDCLLILIKRHIICPVSDQTNQKLDVQLFMFILFSSGEPGNSQYCSDGPFLLRVI